MKNLNKLIMLFASILISYGMDTFAYTYKITNKTGRSIKVQLYYGTQLKQWKLNKEPKIIKKGQSHTFAYRVGSGKATKCLIDIKVAVKKEDGKWGYMSTVERKTNESFSSPHWMAFGLCVSRNFKLYHDKYTVPKSNFIIDRIYIKD